MQGDTIAYTSRQGRLILAATVTASGVAFLDSSVVNVALPHISADLGGGFALVQWVLDAYLLTLGALVLVGGALGDLLGRRRVFEAGIVGFALASILSALAPDAATLVLARAAQGVAAAALVPGSLAILTAVFSPEERGRAIGAWSGASGVFTLLGPAVGGVLTDSSTAGWRGIFWLNLPLLAAALVLSRRGIPDSPGSRGAVDVLGGLLAVLGLAAVVAALIELPSLGASRAVLLGVAGVALLGSFLVVEQRRGATGNASANASGNASGNASANGPTPGGSRRRPPPMLPLELFAERRFSAANLVTLLVYGPLGVVFLLLAVVLQSGLGWSALEAGLAGVPVTVVLTLFSAPVGRLIPIVGARALLTVGPLVMGVAAIGLSRIAPGAAYVGQVLPWVLTFAAGLVLVVAPVTTTALAAGGVARAGIASGVNNAVARIASLLAIAVIPVAAGLGSTGATIAGQPLFDGSKTAMLACTGLLWVGALAAWVGLRREADA